MDYEKEITNIKLEIDQITKTIGEGVNTTAAISKVIGNLANDINIMDRLEGHADLLLRNGESILENTKLINDAYDSMDYLHKKLNQIIEENNL